MDILQNSLIEIICKYGVASVKINGVAITARSLVLRLSSTENPIIDVEDLIILNENN